MLKRIYAATAVAAIVVAGAVAAPKVNDPAPDFTLNDISGGEHHLASLKGESKAVILVWLSTKCPYARAYQNDYEKVYRDYRDQGVTFLGIFSNKTESAAEIKAYAAEVGFTFPVLLDPGAKVADAYGAGKTPEVRVLDSDLKIRYTGAWTNNADPKRVTKPFTRNALDAVLAGRHPDPAETRAFGCTIKR